MLEPRRHRRRTRPLATLALTGWIALATGCAIQPDNAPRDIPGGERGQLEQESPDAGAATGQSRIYLVAEAASGGDRELRTVLRDVEPPTAQQVLTTLIAGANQGELDAGMTSPLPSTTTLHSAVLLAGVLKVDLSGEILELAGSTLRDAVAQIVFTASELNGVRTVRLLVDGQARDWPDGRGRLQSRPLSVYDYPGLAESAQPPYPAVPSQQPDA